MCQNFVVSCVLVLAVTFGTSSGTSMPVGEVVGWGDNFSGQTNIPSGLTNAVAIAAGGNHSLALTADGRVIGWGLNTSGQTNIPIGLSNVVAIAAGGFHSLALTTNGKVVAWGYNSYGQGGVPSGLTNVVLVTIAAGGWHNLAVTTDGRVVAWGNNDYGQSTIPSGLTNVVAIAAGHAHSLALTANGRLVAWGYSDQGQTNIPSGLSNVVAVAAGGFHSLAMVDSGIVVGWGTNDHGQISIPRALSNAVAIAAGEQHSLALTVDGRVVGWGWRYYGQTIQPPTDLSNVVAIAGGGGHRLALRSDGTPTITIQPIRQSVVAGGTVVFQVIAAGMPPLRYQWRKNNFNIAGATASRYTIAAVVTNDAGTYSVVVSNLGNSVTSAGALLTVHVPPDPIAPTVTITSPTANPVYPTSNGTISLAGGASDAVGVTQVTWANSRGGSATASGTTNWTVNGITLQSGTNVITVTARDAAGNTGTDTLTVTYTPPDTTAPAVAVTSPASNPEFSTGDDIINLGGNASDNVGVTQVVWANSWGFSGTASGTTNWAVNGITLQSGINVITVTARDAAGNTGTDTLTVTYTPPDTNAPTVTINSPTSSTTYFSDGGNVNLGGIATDDAGVAQVTWANSRGGSGVAVGTTNWIANGIILQTGYNVIIVTVRDAAGNSGTDTILVRFTPIDTNSPTVTIASPLMNQWFTNALVTVQGTGGDNAQVMAVWYRLNGGPWSAAEGTSNWTASVTALPGTNTIEVYAVDTSGNTSPTSGVTFIYAESDRLQMRVTGQGTLTPNYSNSMLKIGRSSTMTAVGTKGHAFSMWIVSTNWSDGVTITTPKLTFIMQPGLKLEAVFTDMTRPSVAITSPVPGQRISNAVAIVRGRASDNGQLAQVLCQVNTNAWVAATGLSNWTSSLPLTVGTNRVRAVAVDAAGRFSTTNTVTFFHVATSQLTLVTNGLGRITRTFPGTTLEVRRDYSVTAVPATGQLFSNWTGTITATNNPLKFLMQSNMVVQANFVPNPYPALKGSYAGLFQPHAAEAVTETNAGADTFTLTERGTFSGSLRLAGGSLAFTGGFDVGRQATVRVPRTGKPPLWLTLGFDAQTITGQVSTVGWTADLLAVRRATSTSNAFAGRYSMLVMGQHQATEAPPGDSPLGVTVTAPSSVTVSGTMADGSAISVTTGHSTDGVWPFYASLYGGRGLIIGWMSCATNPGSQEVLWVKLPDSVARYYPAGFREQREVALKRYLPPAPKQTATSWSFGRLLIGGGNFPMPLEADVLVTNNLIKRLSGTVSNLTLVITNSNGRFGGNFMHPVTRKPVTVRGILVQGLPWVPPSEQVTVGGGWFIGTTNQDGYLWLEPKP